MYNGNLLKAGWNTVNRQEVKVIDANAMLEKKIKDANATLHVHHTDEIPEEMVDGMDAFTVANLLGEDSVVDPESGVIGNPEELSDSQVTESAMLDALVGENPNEEATAEEKNEGNGYTSLIQPFSSIIKANSVYGGPSPDEVARNVEEKYKEAEREAARIVADAEDSAEAIRSAAHEQGRKAGYDEGYANGLAQLVDKEQELKQKEEELELFYQRKIEELEPQFVDALTGIYEHIFNVELKEYREIIVHLIAGTIRKIEGNKDFIVHVSREDYPYVSMQKKQVQSSATAPNSSVEIIEDLTLAKSECMIETGGGIFDCSLGTELKELTSKLKLLSYEKKEQQQ